MTQEPTYPTSQENVHPELDFNWATNLDQRQRSVFDMLLDRKTPEEIATALKANAGYVTFTIFQLAIKGGYSTAEKLVNVLHSVSGLTAEEAPGQSLVEVAAPVVGHIAVEQSQIETPPVAPAEIPTPTPVVRAPVSKSFAKINSKEAAAPLDHFKSDVERAFRELRRALAQDFIPTANDRYSMKDQETLASLMAKGIVAPEEAETGQISRPAIVAAMLIKAGKDKGLLSDENVGKAMEVIAQYEAKFLSSYKERIDLAAKTSMMEDERLRDLAAERGKR